VYSFFPETKGVPAKKPRPALVTMILELDDGSRSVRVAYGTSQKVLELHSGEFAITPSDGSAYVVSGMSFPTKFNLRRQENLPYTDEWFSVPSHRPFGPSPKLGVLHASLLRRAQAAFDAVNKR
jgi:hypothetical protein